MQSSFIFNDLKCVILVFTILFLNSELYAQSSVDSIYDSFVSSLLKNKEMSNFVNEHELALSQRLGITYKGNKNKFLISNDIDEQTRSLMNSGKIKYSYNIENLGESFNKLLLKIEGQKKPREFYFRNSKLISQPYFLARNWQSFSSRFFTFHISDSTLFNKYCTENLDEFISNTLQKMQFTPSEIEKLAKEKIHYFVCKDENEIEQLTGYKARGLYYIPYDYIITTFSCHYHEIMHLLMNYKIKENDLYTLPFFQEGFAVAFGGRGGKEPNVILGMGSFLAANDFIDYKSILTKTAFYQYDASMTYPLSGLYIKFYLEHSDFDNFLKLYKKYSGSQSQVDKMKIDLTELPDEDSWNAYVKDYCNNPVIKIDAINPEDFSSLVQKEHYSIYENNDSYLLELKHRIDLYKDDLQPSYKSKLFKEIFPGENYNHQIYTVIADSNEVSVYNWFTNNLVAKYVRSFSLDQKAVLSVSDKFLFILSKNVFTEPIPSYKLNTEFNP